MGVTGVLFGLVIGWEWKKLRKLVIKTVKARRRLNMETDCSIHLYGEEGEKMVVKKNQKIEEVKVEEKKSKPSEKWMSVGWVLLLVGGLAHMLPEQMMPVLKYSMYGVSVQMAVGVLSVIVALYYLLGE